MRSPWQNGLAQLTAALSRQRVEARLNEPEPARRKCPRCGGRAPLRAKAKPRTLRTLSGGVHYKRNYHYCDACKHGFYPRDIELDIPEEGDVSEEFERRVLDFMLNDTLEHATERFEMHYEQSVSTNLLRGVFSRVSERRESCDSEWLEESAQPPIDATDTPLVIQSDGSMVSTLTGWREAKLGLVYGLSENDDLNQTRYTGVLGELQDFEDAIEQAISSHARNASKYIWPGDGAKGFWAVAERFVPDAVQILDWYHVMEHAAECAKTLFDEPGLVELWQEAIARDLRCPHRGVETILHELEQCAFEADSEPEREALSDLRRYYGANKKRMEYHRYRSEGWPIGSGAIESATAM